MWFNAYGLKDMGYVDVENEAGRVCEYTCQLFPGLLQTEPYIRAVLRNVDNIDNHVKVRMIRQKRLNSEENPLELVAIIDESALRREIIEPEPMRAQWRHLIAMAKLPTVTVQVLPLRARAHGGMHGAFTVLEFLDPNDQPLLYQAYVTGALHIEDEDEVREAKLVFDTLRSEALSPTDSVALIEHLHAL